MDFLPEDADIDYTASAFIIEDGKILFIDHEKLGEWIQPGGHIQENETPDQAAKRETKEETGIDDIEFIDYIGEVNAENRDPLHVFHCESSQEPALVEPEKFNEWRWFALDEFVSGQPENYISEPSRELIVDYLKINGII